MPLLTEMCPLLSSFTWWYAHCDLNPWVYNRLKVQSAVKQISVITPNAFLNLSYCNVAPHIQQVSFCIRTGYFCLLSFWIIIFVILFVQYLVYWTHTHNLAINKITQPKMSEDGSQPETSHTPFLQRCCLTHWVTSAFCVCLGRVCRCSLTYVGALHRNHVGVSWPAELKQCDICQGVPVLKHPPLFFFCLQISKTTSKCSRLKLSYKLFGPYNTNKDPQLIKCVRFNSRYDMKCYSRTARFIKLHPHCIFCQCFVCSCK